LVCHVLGIVAGLGVGVWDSAEAMHEPLLVVPADVVGGDQLDVAEVAERAASEGRVGAEALVLVQPDRGIGEGVLSNASPTEPIEGRTSDSGNV
jgi:hypothetical protein